MTYPKKTISMKIEEFLLKQPKTTIFMIGLLIMLIVATADFLPHDRLFSFVIFYLVPILLVTWFAGKAAGVFMSLACSFTWLLSDLLVESALPNSITPYVNMIIKLGFFIWIASMLFDLKKALELQKIQSRTDYLTGLFNRRHFVELADREIQRSKRYHHPFTFLYIDVDDFKKVNDRSGHNTGDRLLSAIGRALRDSVRKTDIPVRLGGDEFAVMMPETSFESGQVALKHIQHRLHEIMKERQHKVTFSIGSVTFTRPPESIDEMIRKADHLMYQVKENGKNDCKTELFA